MINVNDTVKNLYSQDSKHISLFIQLGETTLTNSDFHVESMVLDEVLMAEDQLTFGGCNASRFEITLINPDVTIEKGSVIKPYLVIDGSTTKIWLGEFNVTEIIQAKDSLFRGIIALDHMFKFSTFVTEWYNGLTFPMTLKAFRDSLCNHLGIIQNTTTLPFDSLTINKYYDNEEVNAVELIRNICELNGRFGKMDRNGKLSYIALSSVIVDSLDVTNQLKSQPTYFSFVTNAIDGIKVVDSDGTFYRKPDTAQNAYCFTNNRLLYGRTRSELDTIITKLMDNVHIDAVTYQPTSELKIKGMPYLETGDKVHFTSKGTNIYTYVFKRQIRGIQALTDTIRSEGNLDLQYNDNSILNQLANLNRSDERMKVEISSTAEGLQAEITRATGKEGELATSIKATSDGLSAEVTRATNAEGSLSSRITQQADEIALAVKKDTSYNGMKITDNGLEIKGDGAFTVDMNNFKLDEKGSAKIENGEIEAKYISVHSTDEPGTIQPDGVVNMSPGKVGLYNLRNDKNLYSSITPNGAKFTRWFDESSEEVEYEINLDVSNVASFSCPRAEFYTESLEISSPDIWIDGNTLFYDGKTVEFGIHDETYELVGRVGVGDSLLTGIGDGTITGAIKETDTRLNTLAYGEVGGMNLLNCDGLVTKTIGGITFTPVFKNGVLEYINVNGTATEYAMYGVRSNYPLKAGSYIFSGMKEIGKMASSSNYVRATLAYDGQWTEPFSYGDDVYISKNSDFTITIRLDITAGTSVNGRVYPMIRKASITDSTYEPYISYSVKTLGNKADDLKMLGWTVPVECPVQNAYSNNSSTQRVGRLDLSSIDWTYQQNNKSMCFTTKVLDNLLSKAVNGIKYKAYCKGYEIVDANYMWSTATNQAISFASTTPCLRISNNSYTDATAFKNAMKGVYLYYELATPITKNVDGNEIISNAIISKAYSYDSTTFTANQMKYIDFKDKVTIPSGYKIVNVRDNTYRANLMGIPIYVRADGSGIGLNYFAGVAMTVTPSIVVTFAKTDIVGSVI